MLKEEKQQIMDAYKTHEGDTGSPEVQIALLTKRINDLTEHLKIHQKDHHFPPRPAEDGRSSPEPAGIFAEGGHRAVPRHHQEAGYP